MTPTPEPPFISGAAPEIPPAPEDRKSGFFSNILAIAGFIIVIVVIIWGLVHLANISRNWFGSLFGDSSELALEVTAPESAMSGEAFDIEWSYQTEEQGTFAFVYQCVNGFKFRSPSPTGTLSEIPCGAAYTVGSQDSEHALSLTPSLTGTTSIPMPLSILFLPSATGTQAQGSATVMIMGGDSTTPTPTTPAPTTPRPTTPTVPRPVTPADLSVRILAVGVIDQYSGAFMLRAPTNSFETVAVQFEIANHGGKTTGNYYFTAQLPTGQQYVYNSPLQAPLTPGSRIVNTLRFTQTRSGGGTFSVSVDPNYMVSESNESNNYASQYVSAPNWGYQQYPYGQY